MSGEKYLVKISLYTIDEYENIYELYEHCKAYII